MKNIAIRQVTKTSDYSLFVMHEQNRAIVGGEGFKPRKDLVESMKKHGFLESGHIVCAARNDGRLTIIDGHNRFITAKYLGLPIWYVAHPESSVSNPVEHSITAKQWGVADIAKGHAYTVGDYAEVVEYHNRTGIPISASFAMFYGQTASSFSNVSDFMKKGIFSIKTRDYPLAVERVVNAFNAHCNFGATSSLVNAISRAYFAEGFDVNKLIERIHRHPQIIKKCGTTSEYEELLETIYNYMMKSERLYLRVEIEKAMRVRNRSGRSSHKS